MKKTSETESTKHTFEIEYTNAFVDIDAEETLILALLENDDSAIQYGNTIGIRIL